MIPNAPDEIGKTVREHHVLAALRLLNGEDLRGAANYNLLLSLFTLLVARRWDTLLQGALPVHDRPLTN